MKIQLTPWGTIIAMHEGRQYFIRLADPNKKKTEVQIMEYGKTNFLKAQISTDKFSKDAEGAITHLIEELNKGLAEKEKVAPPERNGKVVRVLPHIKDNAPTPP